VAALRDYVKVAREHVRIEDEYFYALATRTLPAEEKERLSQQYRALEELLESPDDRARCEALLRQYREMVLAWAGARAS
jgi:hypothetical protein